MYGKHIEIVPLVQDGTLIANIIADILKVKKEINEIYKSEMRRSKAE